MPDLLLSRYNALFPVRDVEPPILAFLRHANGSGRTRTTASSFTPSSSRPRSR